MNNLRKYLSTGTIGAMMVLSGWMSGQVGINTPDPKVTLDVAGKTTDGTAPEGIKAPSMTGDALNAAATAAQYGAAQDGAVVFVTAVPATPAGQTSNIDCRGYYYFDSTKGTSGQWMRLKTACSETGGSAGLVTSLSCGSAVFNAPSATQNTQYNGTLTVPYTGGNGGAYTSQTFTQNGLTFNLPAGNFNNGTGNLIYNITGTPLSPGNMSVSISAGGQYCSGSNSPVLPVNNNPNGIATLDCGKPTNTGIIQTGTTYTNASGVTTTINYTGGSGAAYSAQTVNSTGVTGLTAELAAGNFANGNGSVTYTITGTASGAGTANFSITLGGISCSFSRTVTDASVTPTKTTGAGTFTGRTCFDVVENNIGGGCGTLEARQSQKANFAQTATNTQIYTFTPSAPVSNVRFVYVNTNGQVIQSITPNNNYTGNNLSTAMSCTVVYYNNLNTSAAGLNRDQALTANIYVVYNSSATNANPAANERQLQLTARVQDCSCCGAFFGPNETNFKAFMCHNLGSDMSLDPFTPTAGIQGAKYAWGAYNGEPKRYVDQTTDQSSTGSIPWNSIAKSLGSWAASYKAPDDPCPNGYKVPSREDYDIMFQYNTNAVKIGPFTSGTTSGILFKSISNENLIMFPAAGQRRAGGTSANDTAAIINRGQSANYWTTTKGVRAQVTDGSDSYTAGAVESNGYPVRCIIFN